MNNIEKLLKINESYEQCECFRIKETKNKIIQVMYEALKTIAPKGHLYWSESQRIAEITIETCDQLAAEVLEKEVK